LVHTSESDWIVTQIDIGYDIPYSNSNKKTKNSSARITKFDFPLQVKQLDRVYQVYNKQLPYKGKCIRIEEQIHFPSDAPSPTLSSLPKTVIPSSAESILDIVVPANASSY
jgi:hypothetical protein